MLQTLREKTSGWIATAILGLLVVPFAFFGMEQYLFQRNETFAAKIEAPPSWWPSAPAVWPLTMLWQREEISATDFRQAFEHERQQQRQQQGEQFDPRQFESSDNKRKVLDKLIDQHVLALAATRDGIAVTDALVRSEIEQVPSFQVDGKFNAQRYQLMLAGQNPAMSPRQFEQSVRDQLRESAIPTTVGQTAFATPAELQRVLRLLGERRDLTVVTLPAPAPDAAPISALEIQKWYDAHQASYRAPETVSLEYIDVNASALPAAAAPTDDSALRQRYEQEKTRFIAPEQRLASHILIKVAATASATVQKAAEQKAAVLAQQAQQPGADFAALARANSDDTGSKSAGGDLGWVAKGVMVKPFEDALYAMQPGEIRGPVKSEFGWHIIQLREVKAGKQVPFEEAREQLVREQGEADRDHAFNDLTGKLVDQINKNPGTLAPAARLANLPVQQSGPVARGQGGGVIANPAVQRVAFSESMIQDGTVSDPIEVGPGHTVLIRVAQHSQEHQLPLAQVAARVIADIRSDRTKKTQAAAADKLVAQVRGGASLKDLAATQGLVASDMPAIPRNAPVPDKVTAEAAFNLPPPAPGKVSVDKVLLPDGRAVVFAVSKITPGNPAEAPPEQKASLQQQLVQYGGIDDVLGVVHALRKPMLITVAEDRL
jgi:peptidyl-prolyl cis-trans isomerase D